VDPGEANGEQLGRFGCQPSAQLGVLHTSLERRHRIGKAAEVARVMSAKRRRWMRGRSATTIECSS
jgi:hypothetical protein